jgi:RpiR family carbohydrate utilization transcriptional regulator
MLPAPKAIQLDYTMNTLNWARRRLDKGALVRAIDALEKAKRIEFFGFGASGILALDAQQKFPLFGVPCLAHTDSHQQFIAAAMMGPGDVAVAFSNTGETVAMIDIARTARENGATVIGVSGSDSPLLRQCDRSDRRNARKHRYVHANHLANCGLGHHRHPRNVGGASA